MLQSSQFTIVKVMLTCNYGNIDGTATIRKVIQRLVSETVVEYKFVETNIS